MHKRSLLLSLGACIALPARALYDPKPSPLLELAVGAWRGTLVYRDYQNPDKEVSLPTRLMVSLNRPEELSLFYVYDDGPGKTVHSYERMNFDFTRDQLTWTSGVAQASVHVCKITLASAESGGARIGFERTVEGGIDRYRLELDAGAWRLAKWEQRDGKPELQRNRYQFSRA